MPVQVLRPNLVEDAEDAGDHTPYPSSASLVGTASTLWRDDNAATYAEMTYQFVRSGGGTVTPSRQDYARAPLDVLTVDSSSATLNSVLVEITGEQVLDDVGSGDGVSVFVNLVDATSYDAGFGDYTVQWQAAALINNTRDGSDLYELGDWSNFTHRDTGIELTAAEVLDFFASGNALVHGTVADNASTNGTYTVSGRIFDVAVTIDYTSTLSPCNATLETSWSGGDNELTTFTSIYGLLDTYTGPSVLDLTIGFTATSASQTEINFVGVWGGWDGLTVDTDLAVTPGFTITADGSPHAYTHTFTAGEWVEDAATIRAALATGDAALRFELGGTTGDLITITDAWLQVGHKCRTKYPLRRYPPVNNGGFGPTRHHPRTVNRRAGGSY